MVGAGPGRQDVGEGRDTGPTDTGPTDTGTDPTSEVFQPVALESTLDTVQPMTGLVLWVDDWQGDPAKDVVQLEYAYVPPSSIVVAEDTYDWTLFDAFPDWRQPELVEAIKDLWTAVAERYDDDPRLAFVQVGFGLWGEYHIYDGPQTLGRTFPDKDRTTSPTPDSRRWDGRWATRSTSRRTRPPPPRAGST